MITIKNKFFEIVAEKEENYIRIKNIVFFKHPENLSAINCFCGEIDLETMRKIYPNLSDLDADEFFDYKIFSKPGRGWVWIAIHLIPYEAPYEIVLEAGDKIRQEQFEAITSILLRKGSKITSTEER